MSSSSLLIVKVGIFEVMSARDDLVPNSRRRDVATERNNDEMKGKMKTSPHLREVEEVTGGTMRIALEKKIFQMAWIFSE